MQDWEYTFNNNPKQGKMISTSVDIDLNIWKILDEEHQYNNSTHRYKVMKAVDWVLIIPKIQKEYIMIWQYRAAWRRSSLEFPAGKLNPNEDPLVGAKRELQEETGLIPKKISLLAAVRPITWATQTCYIYLAEEFEQGETNFDDSEDILTVRLPIEKIGDKIKSCDIVDIPTISAISLMNYSTQ